MQCTEEERLQWGSWRDQWKYQSWDRRSIVCIVSSPCPKPQGLNCNPILLSMPPFSLLLNSPVWKQLSQVHVELTLVQRVQTFSWAKNLKGQIFFFHFYLNHLWLLNKDGKISDTVFLLPVKSVNTVIYYPNGTICSFWSHPTCRGSSLKGVA